VLAPAAELVLVVQLTQLDEEEAPVEERYVPASQLKHCIEPVMTW